MDLGGLKEARIRRGAHWRHMANAIELSMCCGDAACCQITFFCCQITFSGKKFNGTTDGYMDTSCRHHCIQTFEVPSLIQTDRDDQHK